MRKRRVVRGRDWHAWAWWCGETKQFFNLSFENRPSHKWDFCMCVKSGWRKVKFVEFAAAAKKKARKR